MGSNARAARVTRAQLKAMKTGKKAAAKKVPVKKVPAKPGRRFHGSTDSRGVYAYREM